MSKVRYGLAGVILIAGLAGSVFWFKGQNSVVHAGAAAQARSKGPETATVRIVEYSDFQCPACRRAQPTLTKLVESYKGQVQLTFHHFPLSGHLWAGIAHQAAECANDQGQFWGYHDKLFETQSKWSSPTNPTETFLGFAKDLNMDLDYFASCLVSEDIRKRILADRKTGEDMKVSSTPTLFINGERLVGPRELEVKGDALVRQLLGLPPNEVPAKAPVEEDHSGHDH